MNPLGLYIHIPFCVRKCLYCDFVSYSGKEHSVQRYFEALRQEVEWYTHHRLLSEYLPYTLYIGGGTPSLVIEELMLFLESYRDMFTYELFLESTIEVNPGTISFSQFQQLHQAGFNRVSIGVQSFHDRELRILGRIHTSDEAIACFQAARRAGFRNVSLDLIFGIPDSDLTTWRASLDTAISLKPEHISTYNLTIEEGTPFWEYRQQGRLTLPCEDLQLEMYKSGITALTKAGYEQYEISNFALPGHRCHHNQIYWKNEAYLGLGAGAYSYLKGRRYWNYADLDTYVHSCLDGHLDGQHFQSDVHLRTEHSDGRHLEGGAHFEDSILSLPSTAGEECLDLLNIIGETVIMNLRMLEGIDMTTFDQRFGQSLEILFAKPLEKLCSLELIEIQNDRLRLTKKGIYLSNEVFQEFVKT